jgi:hypothetical protein
VAVAFSLSSSAAFAQDGKGPMAAAAEQWEQGALTEAAPLYQKALDQGGLSPGDVVIAYSRIGTVAAASGKREAALSAFRVAAVIDPAFVLPAESGPVAKKLYDEARKAAQKQGGKLEITAEAPDRGDAGKGFTVKAKLPEAFAPVVDKIGIDVRDTLSKTPAWKSDLPAMAEVSFDVPGKAVPGGSTIVVRVSALDQHGNRWATYETRMKIREGKTDAVAEAAVPAETPDESGKKGSFWSTPWPYAIGGAVVVGAVATFLLTRPSSTVTVGAPQWR